MNKYLFIRIFLLANGLVFLVLTWFFLFWFVSLTVGRLLAPWDQWLHFAPPPNTWERQLNDFFSQDVVQILIAMLIVVLSGILFLFGIFRNPQNRILLPLAFALTNLLYLILSFLIIILTNLIDLRLIQSQSSVDIGYHRIWPEILLQGILLGLLIWIQYKVSTSQNQFLTKILNLNTRKIS
jgi:hypothetical protein